MTMASKRHLRHLDQEMAKYNEKWSLSEIDVANAASSKALSTSSVAAAALCTTEEEAGRIIRER